MKIELVVVWCVICLLTKTGWSQSNNETSRRLRIAVPVREFSKFVVIEPDPVTGENNYSGFAIEVFNAVMSALPSSVSYDFVAFAKPDGTMNGTFDDMLKAVDSKDYDGAVGDISILFYRTDYVDFTMPYMESSITMLVPIKQKPTSGRAGQPSLVEITNTSVLATFIISTLVAAMYIIGINSEGNRERDPRLKSRMHMALLIISLATLFITLLASYISSEATSLALYQGRNGSVKNLNQLIRMGSNVGYREGSFIYRLLILKGIPESKLISLKSEDEMLEMLSKGTSKGGVDAIVANAPHLKLLQSKHCDVFTTVPTTNLQATGFGFAFEKGSDLVGDVSKAILKTVDRGQLGKIQDKTIGSLETCQDEPSIFDVNALTIARDRKLTFYFGIILAGIFGIVSLFCLGFSLKAPAAN